MPNNELPKYHCLSGLAEGPSAFGEGNGAEKLNGHFRNRVAARLKSDSEKADANQEGKNSSTFPVYNFGMECCVSMA